MTSLPFLIRNFMHEKEVDLSTIDSLSGVNPERGIFTYRVHSTNKSYIVKNCTQEREFDVYTKHSTLLKENNITIPTLYFSCEDNGNYWIVLEDIPYPLPENRWKADSDQIKLLYHLHSINRDRSFKLEDPYLPFWNDESMEQIQRLLPKLSNNLNVIRTNSKEIFIPICCISGDPNPTNWRLRENGDLVLIDFERIGYGNPAIDLAITIPGFGTGDGSLEHEIAVKYISHWETNDTKFPYSVEELTKQIHVAKLWIALDFLVNNYNTMNKNTLDGFVEQFIHKLKILI